MKLNPAEQHLRNVLCWLKENGFQSFNTTWHQPDRCLLAGSPAFEERCNAIMDKWDNWATEIDKHRPFGYISAVGGWAERGRVRYGAQIVKHWSKEGYAFEIDFDYWRANSGLLGMVGHGIEWLYNKALNKKTDAFKVAKARRWLGESNA